MIIERRVGHFVRVYFDYKATESEINQYLFEHNLRSVAIQEFRGTITVTAEKLHG